MPECLCCSADGNRYKLLWYTTATGGTGSATAPTPSTATPGNTSYWVSQTIGCESPRAQITVTVNTLPLAPGVTTPVTYCQNAIAVPLTATGTNLLWYTTATGGIGSTTAPIPSTTTPGNTSYWVSQTNGSGCESPRAEIAVTVNALPLAPGVTTPVTYCQNATVVPLTATGTNLLWYTTATGGTGSATAPTPSTATPGNTSYWVSQTIGCESPRAEIAVTVNALPLAPGVTTPVTYCQNATAVPLTATGTGLLWYTTATGGTGSATAPTPSTATPGNTSYWVSQTIGCESPRAVIAVTVNALPLAPGVTTPVTYCQNASAVPLTATGTNLLWYTTATGGTGSATAPTPSTAAPGNTSYWVSQTIGCESPRAQITVTVNALPLAPGVTTPVTYCQNAIAVPLTATGTNLLWYTTATGGIGSTTAPIPSTTTPGNTSYWVSQTNGSGCESPRAEIAVTVNALPLAPGVTTPVTYCQNASAVPLTATGTNLLWYTTATGGTGSATAPTPSTAAPGNTSYWVSQTIGCESPRAEIAVTVNALPLAPGVTTPVTYCQNATAVPLTATGTGLLWYTTATGGTGSATAPTPSTATPGNTSYWVSQTIGCESPRAEIAVTVNALPLAPGVTTPVTYCQNATAVPLTATGTGLLWYTTATGGTGSATAPTPSTAAPGNTSYWVSQTIGCESPRAQITVTVNTLPLAPGVTTPVTYCQNAIVVPLTATGTNLLWYTTATGGTGSTTAPTPSTTTPGNTSYWVSQTIGCESPRAEIAVTVNALPLTPGVTTPVTYCQNSIAVPLTATGTNILWYTTATGGTGSATSPTPSTATPGNTSYWVSQTIGCESQRAEITVTVNPLPSVVITNPTAVCAPATVNLTLAAVTAGSTPGLTYTYWTDAAGTVSYTTPTTASAGTYYIKGTSAAGCLDIKPVTVTVNPVPAVVITNPEAVCAPATVNLTLAAVTAGSTPGLTYTYWTDAAGTVSYTTPTAATNGTYYIKGTAASGCFDIQPVTVTVNPLPSVVITNPTAVCAPATVNITLAAVTAGSTAGLTYTYWTDAAGTVSYATPTAATNGTYYIKGTAASGCFDIQPVTVTVNPLPSVTDQTTAILSGNIFTVTPPGVPVGTTYTWTAPIYTGSVTGGIAQAVPQSSISGSLTGTGTATYTVTPASGSCIGNTFTVTVTVTSGCVPVSIGTQPADNSMCATSGNASFTIVANGTSPFTYQWQYNNGGTWAAVVNGTPAGAAYTNANTASMNVAGITAAGSYQYRSYITNCSAANDATSNIVTLTVSTNPSVVITNPAAVCAPATVNITLAAVTAGSTPGLTYTYWTDAAGTVSYATPTAATNGTYYIKGTAASGCFDIQPVTVTINPLPSVVITNPAAICAPATVNLTLSAVTAGSTPGLTYTYWTDAAGTVSYTTPTTASAGTYYIKGTSAAGCLDIKPVTVTVNPAPAVVITNPEAVCAPATVNLTLAAVTAGSTPGLTYTYWTDAAGTVSYTTPTAATNGTYYIKGTAASGCFDIQPVTVTVNPLPTLVITNPTAVCAPATVNLTLSAVTAGSTAGLTYTYWTDAAGTVSFATPTAATNGTYYIKGTAASGCFDIQPVTVTVNPLPSVTDQTTAILSGNIFTVTPPGVPVGTTYTWTAPIYTGSVTGGIAQAVPQSSISGSLTGTGTATYTVTPASGSCIGTTFTVTVTVTSGCVPVSIGTQPADNSMCATSGNASFTIVANGTSPFTYQWQYNNGGTWAAVVNGTPAGAAYTNANTATLNVAGITSAGSYQYRSYITNCSAANDATSNIVTLTVSTNPSVVITNPEAVCAPATVNITLAAVTAGSTPGLTYTYWTDAAGTVSYATPTAATNGTYYIKGTAASGCFDIQPVTVTVNPLPSVVITNPTAVCAPATVNITLAAVTAGSTPGLTYTYWTDAAGTVSYATPTAATNGTYYIKGTAASGCFDIQPVTVTVNPLPNVTDQTTAILSGNIFTVTPPGVPVGTTYTWTAPIYTGTVSGGSVQTSPQPNISGSLTGTGTATYTVTPASGSCIGTTFTVTVTVTSGCVPVSIGTQPADNSMCATSGNASFTIVANGTSPFTYQWQYNNGGTWAAVVNGTPAGAAYTNANTATMSVAGITSAGSYQYRSYITNCSAANDATSNIVTLTVSTNPSVVITNPEAVCAPATVNITLAAVTAGSTPGLTYTYWTDAAGTVSYATPTAATNGTYYIKGTAASGCFDIQPVTVTVNPLPSVTDQTTAILSGNIFTVTPPGVPVGTTYTWLAPSYTGTVSGGSVQTSPQPNISGSLTGTGTATYTVTPASGSCIGTTFTVTVTVTSGCVPVSIGTQPADNSMCATSGNASFTIVANGTSPFTYQWQYNNGGTWAAVVNGTPAGAAYTNANTATLNVAGITSAGSYQYRSYITNCSAANDATSNIVTLTVSTNPSVVITNPEAVCAPATVNITLAAVTAGSTPGLTYTYWTDAAGTVSYATPTAATNGIYYIKGTAASGCFDIQPVTVTVNPLPNVTDQTTAILSGNIFTVTPPGVPVGTTYTWLAPSYTGTVSGGSVQTSPQPNISGSLTGTGTATYTVTPTSGTCTGATFTVTVTVTSGCVPVSIGTQPADNSMCATSGNASFTVVPNGTAPFTYQWQYNNGGTWAAVVNGTPAGAAYTNANTASMNVAGITSAGSYQYRSYITNCSAANDATSNIVTLTVSTNPSVVITNPAAVCAPATVNITLAAVTAGSTPGLTYTYWTDAAGTVSYATPTAATNGTYYIKGTAASGCFDIQPVTVTVNPLPNVTDQTTAILSGNIFTVTPPGVPVGTTYTWTAPIYTGSVTGGIAQAVLNHLSVEA